MKQMIYENKKPTPGQLVHIMIDRPMNSYSERRYLHH